MTRAGLEFGGPTNYEESTQATVYSKNHYRCHTLNQPQAISWKAAGATIDIKHFNVSNEHTNC